MKKKLMVKNYGICLISLQAPAMFHSLSQSDHTEPSKPLSNLSNVVLGEHGPSLSPSSQASTPPTSVAAAAPQGEASGGSKKSSFDRIVEKLGPTYPDYSRYV